MKKRRQSSMIIFGQLATIFVLIVVIFFVFAGIWRSVKKERQLSKEVQKLKQDVNKFRQENSNVNKLTEYLSTKNFQEKEIKEKLNLTKHGEKVLVVQELKKGETVENGLATKQHKVIVEVSNYYRWWLYFFGKNDK